MTVIAFMARVDYTRAGPRYHESLPSAKTVSLKKQAQDFHEYLFEIKQKRVLHEVAQWYPWSSLGQFDILDGFLKGDVEALLKMIGRNPVIDVACGDGDISFFLESLGARVEAVDHAPTNYNAMLGVRTMKEILQSPLVIQATDLDTQPTFPSRSYGFAVMLGVLYHLKNPFLALEALARSSRYAFFSAAGSGSQNQLRWIPRRIFGRRR
jgi:2-polyprenyl-3-methyl-5-hydroxy-6-metoxy-1,4-benzoquinol methylase